ncbi:MAG: carbon-nitrogen family hydrolase [Peptoniphilaceae bacterium]
MKVSIIQNKLILGKVDENFKIIENKIIESMKDNPDVILLPEMWNTSFFPDNVKEIADIDGFRTKKFLSKLSSKFSVNIVGGSVANIRNKELYNTSYIFNRHGKLIGSYDKVHLFSPSGEDKIFNSGNKLCTFELDRIKCGICICYDLRFVEWIRMNALEDISILFIPAAWPDKRIMHWNTLNRARAIENQMFVVCSNSIGETKTMKFGGNSSIIDPWGEYIIEPNDKDEIKIGEIDLSIIKDIRESINVFRDRKNNLYKL